MNRGYIKLWRSSMDHPDYFSEPFTRWQAWIDLLLRANHQDARVNVRGIMVSVKAGQVLASEEYLAQRWQWSRGKVRRFLAHLVAADQVSRETSVTVSKQSFTLSGNGGKAVQQTVQQTAPNIGLISIVNWPLYQGNGGENGTTDGTTNGTTDGQQTDIRKNDKKKAVILSTRARTRETEVTPEFLATMRQLFPGIDVELEWEHCRTWCEEKRKAPSRSCLINWLKRTPKSTPASADAPREIRR